MSESESAANNSSKESMGFIIKIVGGIFTLFCFIGLILSSLVYMNLVGESFFQTLAGYFIFKFAETPRSSDFFNYIIIYGILTTILFGLGIFAVQKKILQ